ncbi:MAG TPA: cytochrome C [Bradyrhizobium sp.]|nr:cytochrome C [Bradyrhizobium sp.]
MQVGCIWQLLVRHKLVAAGVAALLAEFFVAGLAPPAQALPSFARQTGQPCGTCHTSYPSLTPFGRRFKLLGYTTGGGLYRTTPFSTKTANDVRAEYDRLRGYAADTSAGAKQTNAFDSLAPTAPAEKGWVPPVSMMAIVGFTHTQVDIPPPADPYHPNDNTVLSPFSAFWGGAITDNVGAFAQVTYNAPGPVSGLTQTPADQFVHNWTWDNTDVRFAGTTKIGSVDVVYGITANNNPTVQDLWNTTPAWSFPFAVSTLGTSAPGAATMLEGGFAAHVGGVGAYAMFNDMLYVEATGYRTLSFSQQNSLGVDPFGSNGLLNGVAPYWRVAFEPHWGPHTFMVGTYGAVFDVNPWIDPSFVQGTTGTLSVADRFTDIGIDSQYQYQGPNYWVTLRANYLREFQKLDASFSTGNSANLNNELNTLRLTGEVTFGGDNRFALTGQYFKVWGTPDANLFSAGNGFANNSPNSDGWMAELDYIPFAAGKAPGWPWFNAKIGLQYIYFNKFNGTTVGAQDNNTLFLHAWFAM